jgi:lysozyme
MISNLGLILIQQFEGFRSKPYLCQAGVPTIGYGATYYDNGKRVKLSDTPISVGQALQLLKKMVVPYCTAVNNMTRDDITQNQFDALVSFAYNLGNSALKNSTLLKKVNANPNNKGIALEFSKWINANGKPSKGLIARRKKEVELYFSL